MAKTNSIDHKTKPLASISLDLDNQWSYMKTHGDAGWESFPSYLDTFIPLVLDTLDEFDLKITFFIVGQDAALEKNHGFLRMITERGHEVGNHSFHHEVWLHEYPKDKIKDEILRANEHIHKVAGQKPLGFRGPGFVYSPALLEVLAENNFLYDATILPTFLGPLARMYYFWKSDLSKNEREQRKKIYSSFREGMRPVNPFYWQLSNEKRLLEIPVSTMPIFKTPFHLSYLIYLGRFSYFLMIMYLKLSVTLCRLSGVQPSYLLHPLDFISGDIAPSLKFFPGMDLESHRKAEIFKKVIRYLLKNYSLQNMGHHANLSFKTSKFIKCIE